MAHVATRTPPLGIHVHSSHPTYQSLIQDLMDRPDVDADVAVRDGVANVLLDFPATWALYQAERMESVERARTLIVTQSTHPAYLDCLGSYHVSGVAASTDATGIVAGLYAAATGTRSYHYRSPLTHMELRAVRLVLMGHDTISASRDLGVTPKTINAHISNVLGKLGYENRAHLIVGLLGVGAL